MQDNIVGVLFEELNDLKDRVKQLEDILKEHDITFHNPELKLIEDKEYPFILKVQHKTMRSCHTDVWTDITYKTLYWEGDDPNGFETADEAITYVKAHPEIFTGIKVYLYNNNTNTIKKIKKGY